MNVTQAHLRDPVSIVVRAGGFLFTPFPFIDNGSLFLDISSLEAPFWWFMYITFGIAVWRRFKRKEFDELAIFIISFIVLFTVFSALTEVNVGTMIRHRSVLLIPVLFLAIPLTKGPLSLVDKPSVQVTTPARTTSPAMAVRPVKASTPGKATSMTKRRQRKHR